MTKLDLNTEDDHFLEAKKKYLKTISEIYAAFKA